SATNSTNGQQQTTQHETAQITPQPTNKGVDSHKVKPTNKDGSNEKTVANNNTQRPADDGKQNPPVKESPKTEPLIPTAAFSEDLRMVDVGDRPKQWKCDNSIALMKGQDGRPYLHATKEGNHNLTTPDLALHGDFYVEYEFEMGPGQLLEATLLGSDGSSNLSIKFDAGAGGNPADLYFHDSVPRYVMGVDGLALTRMRLERERNIYRVSLNGKPTHARRLSGFTDFAGVRFTMPG